jgi:hypothetical protein
MELIENMIYKPLIKRSDMAGSLKCLPCQIIFGIDVFGLCVCANSGKC